ncbi:MAG: pyridoxal phosphate-dependent aminotransferase [Sinobacteraceae bacterium]|nr:pyridoxal phosphate-dependent aminotransferase [Nevskiaceae bacterium]
MTIQLAARARRIKPSPTLAVTARAGQLRAEGKDVLSLSAGEPDFDTPEHVKAAAIQAIADGKTKYTPVGGTPALKAAIAAKHKRDNGLDYTPSQIIASTGGKQACYNICQTLLDDGDEVLILAPYWVSYPAMAELAGGVPVVIKTTAEARFKITPQQLEQAITPRTKLLFLNSPSNPSGMIYNKAELAALGEVLLRYPQVFIATDDMYEHIRWTGEPFSNILNACPALTERTLVISAVSKTYAMTGWRLGWACGPENVVKAMSAIQSQSTSNPNSIAQAAAEAALNGDQTCVGEMVAEFHKRHDNVVAGLNKIPGVQCLAGDGTFYVFPNVEGLIRKLGVKDDIELAKRLLDDALVALVPGTAFGTPGHLRLSFATSPAVLDGALERIAKLAN